MSNLIHFKQAQLAQFDHLAQNILSNPERYLQFDSIADFYQAQWLDDFPQGTTWYATGLDDGAEHFDIRLACFERVVFIHIAEHIVIQNGTH